MGEWALSAPLLPLAHIRGPLAVRWPLPPLPPFKGRDGRMLWAVTAGTASASVLLGWTAPVGPRLDSASRSARRHPAPLCCADDQRPAAAAPESSGGGASSSSSQLRVATFNLLCPAYRRMSAADDDVRESEFADVYTSRCERILQFEPLWSADIICAQVRGVLRGRSGGWARSGTGAGGI
eukprot:scaffold17283_cov121-Isochrysis_galbana.AAC.1